jgi:GT2 family glycosyltransferase
MQAAIVIPVFNQLGYTQGCLRCLEPDVASDVHVIIVNNGSSDGTREWLAGRAGIHVIHNEQNRGCAPAWNQGLALARTLLSSGSAEADDRWIVVLNNDVLLPAGWLQALIGAAERHRLDIVCPAMRERDQNYDFEAHARQFMTELAGVVRRGASHGVCFAVRETVFAKIGGFDEAFRIGQFEDADFFRRARLAGFRSGTVGACFIHHFGSVTQDSMSTPQRQRPYEAENRAYFRKKWKLSWLRRKWEKTGQALRAWVLTAPTGACSTCRSTGSLSALCDD